jgi:hypothetical protein
MLKAQDWHFDLSLHFGQTTDDENINASSLRLVPPFLSWVRLTPKPDGELLQSPFPRIEGYKTAFHSLLVAYR